MNENAIDRKLVCAFIAGLISDDGEREKGLEYIRNMPPVNPMPCENAISRQAVLDIVDSYSESQSNVEDVTQDMISDIMALPSVNPQPKTETWSIKDVADTFKKHGLIREQEPKTGRCKDCKYFEYDSVAKVDGVPLIVAHEICSRWGDGCKTKEDGYCFLYEPQERSGEE